MRWGINAFDIGAEDVMDRGAVSPLPSVPVSPADVLPPFEWALVRRVARVGVGLIGCAVALGLVAAALGDPPPDSSLSLVATGVYAARLFLVLFGALTVGAAVSMRADLWQTWALAAGGALLAVFGTPASWDSFRLLFGVLAAIALVWALLRAGPARYRLPVLTALLLFHFSGIFFATTTPPQTPWLTEQAFLRVYNPYLQFVYLRNAYHFYSPEPGAASILVFLLKTEVRDPATGQVTYKTKWVVTPRRPGDVKDPLGLTYYRRLSITEQVARAGPGLALPGNNAEKVELRNRRAQVQAIPPPSTPEEAILQYRLPQPEVSRYVIPSYASHIILENTANADEAARTTVKMYRLEHATMSVDEFINWRGATKAVTDPYHPSTFRPYFLGEFNARGELLNPQEPMLYWLVPVYPRPGGIPPGDQNKREFIDFLSIHALDPLNLSIDEVDDPKFRDRVFDWNQLR
jgi:hypothetical protein